MRNLYLLALCFFTFGLLSAQEKLSKEEQERREKNIQAGNPFAKYGYKAKVATLSKGKYLEVHDLDSIVTIGTVRWNVNQNKIVAEVIQDTLDMYAQPIGDVAGRWMSPDPLSEEFPEWSPYTFTYNNPVVFVDPTGLAGEWIPGTDGEAISYTVENGQISVSANATADTQKIVAGINESGSETARNQFTSVADSEGKVNLVVDTENTGANGKSLNGLHQPHDAQGSALNWDSDTQTFDGVPETFVDSNGNTTYAEATITIFESNFNDNTQNKFGVLNKTGVWDSGLTKSNAMTGTFSHEVDHNQNRSTIQAVGDRASGKVNNYNVETPAYNVQKTVHQEIKANRTKN